MFWYAVVVLASCGLIWRIRIRSKLRRIDLRCPALYDAAAHLYDQQCPNAGSAAHFAGVYGDTPLAILVAAFIASGLLDSPRSWHELPPRLKKLVQLYLAAETLSPLEQRYVNLFLNSAELALVRGFRQTDFELPNLDAKI